MTANIPLRHRTLFWTPLLVALIVLLARAQELPLGSALPMANASFANVAGGQASLGSLAGEQGTVVVFWSNQCPWVERYQGRLSALAQEFGSRGFRFVLV